MRPLLLTIALFVLSGCRETPTPPKRMERTLVPEPDKVIREQQEALSAQGCVLPGADTSLSGICLGDAASTIRLIGNKDKPDDDGCYRYYGILDNETLTLVQQPGDYAFQISEFKVGYSDKADHGYRQLPVKSFTTGRGIHLGMSRAALLERLGPCCMTTDSGRDFLTLRYQLRLPADTRDSLLRRHNMPVYYGTYQFMADQLYGFAFGFEYP